MNLLQAEYGVLPTKVMKEDKARYIQALIDTRESEDLEIFQNCMIELHCEQLKRDIDAFTASMELNEDRKVDRKPKKWTEKVDRKPKRPSSNSSVRTLGFHRLPSPVLWE